MIAGIREYWESPTSRLFLLICVFSFFWSMSARFSGPAYLRDEIGYLANASCIAGFVVDAASSFHSGYSIFLAPLFRLFDNPLSIWQGIMFLNSIIWMLSFMILFKIADSFFPDSTESEKKTAVLVTSLYPTWISMCGYAFPSTILVLFVLLAYYSLYLSKNEEWYSILPHSLLTGFLYWIHPTALAAAMASIIVLLVRLLYTRNKSNLLTFVANLVTLATICLIHKVWVVPLLYKTMTPQGFSGIHHYPAVRSVIETVFSLKFAGEVVTRTMGQISYLTIASCGFFISGVHFTFAPVLKWIKEALSPCGNNLNKQKTPPSKRAESGAFLLLSTLGVLMIGAIMLTYFEAPRIDQWIKGRYGDPFCLVIFFFGFFSMQRRASLISWSALVIPTGFAIDYYIGNSPPQNNFVGMQSFWPLIFIDQFYIPAFMIIGFLVICMISYCRKELKYLIIALLYLATIWFQYNWHKKVEAYHCKPESLVEFIKSRLPEGGTIGLEPDYYNRAQSGKTKDVDNRQWQILQACSFYLYNYDYRRINIGEWKQLDGPKLYFAFNPVPLMEKGSIRFLARKQDVSLLVCGDKTIQYAANSGERYQFSTNIYVSTEYREAELLLGCFYKRAADLILFSQVGRISADKIVTDANSGHLLFGPQYRLRSGKYILEVEADILKSGNAFIYVASCNGAVTHAKFALVAGKKTVNGKIRMPFTLEKNALDMEIHLVVTAKSDIQVSGYEVILDR